MNKELQQAIKNSLRNITIPNGWSKIDVPGDGTCGYHAIMKSLSVQNNRILRNIANNSKNNNPLFTSNSGFALRVFCAHKLKRAVSAFENFLFISSLSNIPNNYVIGLTQELNRTINEYDLMHIPMYTVDISNYQDIIDSLNQIINKLQNFNPFSKKANGGVWIDVDVLHIISKLLKKNIFIYNSTINNNNKWVQFIGNDNPYDPNSSIFLFFNGAHYDTLVPDITKQKVLKNRFNNLPIRSTNFNYDFLRNI